jgi:hypothetical protein
MGQRIGKKDTELGVTRQVRRQWWGEQGTGGLFLEEAREQNIAETFGKMRMRSHWCKCLS